ncbi:4125_t:CDS:1 [Acaulospora morrowiae]|uniref:4125_t:CDS:1 n=1 Tax=Acaulospora morrowiae TaxID=94023 RepID=A0A9N8YWX5_9GLOM|nr:4125_t:CDS:1 [Acaulospora morrowiae]
MPEIRSVLLIGKAGNGKSTLANVITGTDGFNESTSRIRGTTEVKSLVFEHEGIEYRIFDTVGIGDPIKPIEEILSKLGDEADIIGEGLNQILFVTRGRFTKEEVEAFKLLKNIIFDEQVTGYTTIVCTDFPDFENDEACEKDRQSFREEIKNLSTELASTNIIYVDNPPIKGRYKLLSKDSREASRRILLEHLKTCQEIYRPELLAKFSQMIGEFNSIIEDTNKAIDITDSLLIEIIYYLSKFLSERERIIKVIEESRKTLKEYMENRFTANTVGNTGILAGKFLAIAGIWFPLALVPGAILSVGGWLSATSTDSIAIVKEDEAYKLFEESLIKDKEKCEALENFQIELKKSLTRFKDICPRFKDSKYKKQKIDRKKIVAIKNVLERMTGEEVETDVNLRRIEEVCHSTGFKIGRAALEAICKLVPSPISLYFIYRDFKEVDQRASLSDMENTINNWKEELETLKEKKQLLEKEYQNVVLCKEEMAKILSNVEDANFPFNLTD